MADRLYNDPDLVQFYDIENEAGPDFDYCLMFAGDARSVLDLGRKGEGAHACERP